VLRYTSDPGSRFIHALNEVGTTFETCPINRYLWESFPKMRDAKLTKYRWPTAKSPGLLPSSSVSDMIFHTVSWAVLFAGFRSVRESWTIKTRKARTSRGVQLSYVHKSSQDSKILSTILGELTWSSRSISSAAVWRSSSTCWRVRRASKAAWEGVTRESTSAAELGYSSLSKKLSVSSWKPPWQTEY